MTRLRCGGIGLFNSSFTANFHEILSILKVKKFENWLVIEFDEVMSKIP